jgi:hypothetical protein
MPLFWLITGTCATLAVLVVLLPWLRQLPRFNALLARRWISAPILCTLALCVLGAYLTLRQPQAGSSPSAADSPGNSSGGFGDAVRAFDAASGESRGGDSNAPKPAASSMDSAVTNLESRLAKGGGSADDWELLAKSFEFLGRPADAISARAHQLPAGANQLPADARQLPAGAKQLPAGANSAGTSLSGEVALAAPLAAKVSAGETLFIIAKSVNSPGPPVAVLRGSVGDWPMKFSLDDSLAMLPGRNLSSAGPVMIEARISVRGQPLPASGDLQGSVGPLNPSEHAPLNILIDRIIR